MKIINYLMASICFVIIFITNSFSQTTQEEYNYLTKGYKVQIESGLDMKKGYSLLDLGEWGLDRGAEKRICNFKGLVKQGQTKPSAILMIYKRTDITNGAIHYICIPSANASSEIWQQTLSYINANSSSQNSAMMETMIWALMKVNSQQITK